MNIIIKSVFFWRVIRNLFEICRDLKLKINEINLVLFLNIEKKIVLLKPAS